MRRVVISGIAAFFTAASVCALDYHARIEHVADHRDSYAIMFQGRTISAPAWSCSLIAERRADANPSAMLAAGPTIIPPDTAVVAIEPGVDRAGNVYWCRVWVSDSDGNRVAAELLISVVLPRGR
uniref:Uncharacterized protein n=1 Tax=uncultured prokaryote TaxID=198431 RepID=H5SEF3_9ZZZZ|nr:hypothetical protein HGMM_F16F12C05 [uncultured prokaryote]